MIKNIPPTLKFNSGNRNKVSDSSKYIPKPYKDVAKGMEEQFARYMIEQMKKTIDKNKVCTTKKGFLFLNEILEELI